MAITRRTRRSQAGTSTGSYRHAPAVATMATLGRSTGFFYLIGGIGALQAGAVGYLTKDAGASEIRQALERVRDGQAVIDPAVQRLLVDAVAAGTRPTPAEPPSDGAPPDGLTPREAEVLSLIAAGLSNAEIAARLVVSEATVKSHINHLLPKIGARDRAQAVSFAYQHGLNISP